MFRLRLFAGLLLAGLAGCDQPASPQSGLGAWRHVALTPGVPVTLELGAIASSERGELEFAGLPERATWIAVADGRELAAGRLFPTTAGLFGLHTGGGPLQVKVTLPETAVPSELVYRMRIRPAFEGEEDEALTTAPSPCDAKGCTGVIGWPADMDRFLFASQGGAGTELRLTPTPGVAWDVSVMDGPNLRAQSASAEGEGVSVTVHGAGTSLTAVVRSRTDGSSPLPYRVTLRGLGGPLVKP